MKQISFKISGCFSYFGKEEECDELVFSYSTGDKTASISDQSETKDVDCILFERIWSKFQKINFNKVLEENSCFVGCDGFMFDIEMANGMNNITVSLWSPSLENYKSFNCSESLELMELVNEMIGIGEVNGLNFERFEDDEEDYDDEDEPWVYEVGEPMDFLPREAVYSVQIELREIKKIDDEFEMTVAVRDPDSGEYQTFTEKLKEGSVLLWDGLEPGVVCFAGPDRVAVKLTVIEISENGISFSKESVE